jgi:hypothetical protein
MSVQLVLIRKGNEQNKIIRIADEIGRTGSCFCLMTTKSAQENISGLDLHVDALMGGH